jgi:hypothetical protein
MKKALLVLLFLGVLNPFLAGCCLNDSCGCGSFDEQTYRINDLGVTTQLYSGSEFDNTLYYSNVELIKLVEVVDYERISQMTPTSHAYLTPMAYACEPPPPIISNEVVSVVITAMEDFTYLTESDLKRNGENITDMFEVAAAYSNDFFDIDQYFGGPNDFRYYYPGDTGWFQLRLKDAPFQETCVKVNIILVLEDGSMYEFVGEELKVS